MTEEQPPIAINQSAIALIRRWFDGTSRWLVLADDRSMNHRLVEAERLQEESFRESIDREIAWQLNLQRGKDYIVSSVPRLHLEIPFEVTHGCSDGTEQRIDVVEFYLIELYGKRASTILDDHPNVHWWSTEQLYQESETAGILSRQRQILLLADILREDHHDG